MNENNFASSSDQASRFDKFLWWLSTAEPEIIHNLVVDRNRYRIVGYSVLATWLFANFCWIYFFYTTQNNLWLSLFPGLLMGFIILTIDRALIKGINRKNKNKLTAFAFRGLLALTIGGFMAQPALLYIFKNEIALQISLDNEKRKLQKSNDLDVFYKNKKETLQQQKNTLLLEQSQKLNLVNEARNNYLAETDGSGGSGKIGLKAIAQAKQKEYLLLDTAYQNLVNNQKLSLATLDSSLQAITVATQKEQLTFEKLLNSGFLTQIEALNNLLKTNSALQWRYYLILFILILIELMPVISKALLPGGSYEKKVALQEELEINMAETQHSRQLELEEFIAEKGFEEDKEMVEKFFNQTKKERGEKASDFTTDWKAGEPESFAGLLQKFKRNILTGGK